MPKDARPKSSSAKSPAKSPEKSPAKSPAKSTFLKLKAPAIPSTGIPLSADHPDYSKLRDFVYTTGKDGQAYAYSVDIAKVPAAQRREDRATQTKERNARAAERAQASKATTSADREATDPHACLHQLPDAVHHHLRDRASSSVVWAAERRASSTFERFKQARKATPDNYYY
jgi:hypothetical protein